MIALANSAAIICDGLEMNVDRVLEGLQSKVDQFGLGLAKPGIGPGGHCIPEDIHYVIKKARQNGIDTRFLDDAAELNDKMPRYAVYKLARIVRQNNENLKDLNVALLGLAYKPDIADLRRSPSIEVGYQLLRNTKNVIAYDPYITNADQTISGVVPAKSLEEALEIADVVFIGTAHKQFSQEIDGKLLSKYNIRYVLDGRNCLDDTSIITENIKYAGIGK